MATFYEKGEDVKEQWCTAPAEYNSADTHLEILGKPVMERWETPFMHKIASIAASRGGHVLEVGFGMAISATKIQSFDIEEHVIIEYNDSVFNDRLLKWAKGCQRKITPLKGMWQKVAPTLQDESFDGILYDAFPLSEDELYTHYFDFIKAHAKRLLKPGGVLTYGLLGWLNHLLKTQYSGVSDIEKAFQETQVKEFVAAGFKEENITYEIVHVEPGEDCRYYNFKQVIAATVIKD